MSDEQRQTGSDAGASVAESVGGSEPVDRVAVERPSAGPVDPAADEPGAVAPEVADVARVEDGPTVDLARVGRTRIGEGLSDEAEPSAPDAPDDPEVASGPGRRPTTQSRWSSASLIIAVLLALLGFTLVVQLRTTSADPELAATRQEDLVRILSDLESQKERLRQDIAGLEDSQRQLASGAQGRQAALAEATRRADELGILAGTLPARGPGLTVTFSAGSKPIGAATVLDAVQELRGAGAEAMQIAGGGATVRIVASTYFLDEGGGITVSGRRLTGPYTITVIGDPSTMRTALNIPGGVVASVSGDGGNVIVQEREVVDVATLSAPLDLKHARPVS
jgi:uncharacterized protein YlxW (UPF0749 family)